MTRQVNHKARGIIGILAIIVTLVWNTAPGAEVMVQVDPGKVTGRSAFQIGVSHVTKAIHQKWGGDPVAIRRAMTHHELALINLQNVHIMGWGVGNPNPAPGIYSWDSLDDRIARVTQMKNAQLVITFCTAPGWMKVSGKDWNMNDRVADGHFADFAELCAKIANRYPAARYFQVWNEFKGFWDREKATSSSWPQIMPLPTTTL